MIFRDEFFVRIEGIEFFTDMMLNIADSAVNFVEILRNIAVHDGVQFSYCVAFRLEFFIVLQKIYIC